jgi:hypothetical protein
VPNTRATTYETEGTKDVSKKAILEVLAQSVQRDGSTAGVRLLDTSPREIRLGEKFGKLAQRVFYHS